MLAMQMMQFMISMENLFVVKGKIEDELQVFDVLISCAFDRQPHLLPTVSNNAQ